MSSKRRNLSALVFLIKLIQLIRGKQVDPVDSTSLTKKILTRQGYQFSQGGGDEALLEARKSFTNF